MCCFHTSRELVKLFGAIPFYNQSLVWSLLGQLNGLLWSHIKAYICCSFALTSILLWYLFDAHYCDIWEQRSLRTDTISSRKQNFVLLKSRRILLIHKAHQSTFHTMQAMCILYTRKHRSGDSCGISLSLKKNKNEISEGFLEVWKNPKQLFKAKVLLSRLSLDVEISITLKNVWGFYTWSLLLY